MTKYLQNLCLICCLFVLCFCFVGCGSNLKSDIYLYSVNGSAYGYYSSNGYLYDEDTHRAIAKFDKDKQVFYNNSGYFGEVIEDCYIVYNLNSPYINQTFPTMPVAPIIALQPIPPLKAIIPLPAGYRAIY